MERRVKILDIIESVKAAEERADKIRKDATLEGQALVSSYEKRGREDSAALVAKAKAEAEEILNKARLEAERDAEGIFNEAKENNKAIEDGGRKKLDDAALRFISLIEETK